MRREGYIGLCFGPAGVGKTVSARRYAHWDTAETLLDEWGPGQESDAAVYAALARSRTVFYTPSTTATLRQLDSDLTARTSRVNICIDQHVEKNQRTRRPGLPHYVELLVIDEADGSPRPRWSTCATASTATPSGCC